MGFKLQNILESTVLYEGRKEGNGSPNRRSLFLSGWRLWSMSQKEKRKPFKRRDDQVTRETIALAILYASLFGIGMYLLIGWMG